MLAMACPESPSVQPLCKAPGSSVESQVCTPQFLASCHLFFFSKGIGGEGLKSLPSDLLVYFEKQQWREDALN